MKYKGLKWTNLNTDINPEYKTCIAGYDLLVFIMNDAWQYGVVHNGFAVSEGFDFPTVEQAMREAIFDAMVLKMRDSK